MQSYEDVIVSPGFLKDLKALNAAIVRSLEEAGEASVINGNVLYTNRLENFHKAALSEEMEPKRRALVAMAQRSRCFVEVGVAGGHAVLLALHANPDMKAVGIDMAVRVKPFWPPVDVFVPAAAAWMEKRFPDRFKMIRKEAVEGLREVEETRPFGPVDMLHLDGGKIDRIQELKAIWPALTPRAYLMQGDYLNGHVQADTAMMMRRGLARAIAEPDFPGAESRIFKSLEIGQEVLSGSLSLKDFKGKRVLLCTAHQDDEVLFAGGLLGKIAKDSEVTVASFFRPAKGRKDTETRIGAMKRLCASLGVDCVQYPFAVEAHHRLLKRFIVLRSEPEERQGRTVRPIHRHGLYPVLTAAAFAAIRQYEPDIVITHNREGEYGHREHALLHHGVSDAARRSGTELLLTFGIGQEGPPSLTVSYDRRDKKKLFEVYMPQWDGGRLYEFALEPETYMREALFPAAG